MDSKGYIAKIEKEQACSILTAEELTAALHREGRLHPDLMVRFKLLFGAFDIITIAWFKAEDKSTVEGTYSKEVGEIGNLNACLKQVAKEYKPDDVLLRPDHWAFIKMMQQRWDDAVYLSEDNFLQAFDEKGSEYWPPSECDAMLAEINL